MALSKPHRKKKRQKYRTRQQPKKTAEVRIDAIGARGDGLARHEGQVIYVPYTASGDVARINYRGDRGVVETLITESPDRASPPCPYFGVCGGCALQHINERAYQSWKHQRVVDALAREGFAESLVAPLIPCAPATRRRAQFTIRKHNKSGPLILGFNERASDRVIDLEECAVLDRRLAEAILGLRKIAEATPGDWRQFDMMATLCDNGVDVCLSGGDARDDLSGATVLQMTEAARGGAVIRICVDDALLVGFTPPVVAFGGVNVAIPPGGFLQASRQGEEALTGLVLPHLDGAKRIADLFAGCGTFTLPMAARAHVDAFDFDGPAIAALEAASRESALGPKIKGERRNLFERPLMAQDLKTYDAVLIDPPRAGARAQAEQLAQSDVATIISVSCNPSSFARDAAILLDGGYTLSRVTPVDQFVYSTHVELVGIFQRG